jgi:hypothetical protein
METMLREHYNELGNDGGDVLNFIGEANCRLLAFSRMASELRSRGDEAKCDDICVSIVLMNLGVLALQIEACRRGALDPRELVANTRNLPTPKPPPYEN